MRENNSSTTIAGDSSPAILRKFSVGEKMILFWLAAAVFAVVLFRLIVFHQYNSPRYVKLVNKIPGPVGMPFFGSTIHFWNLKHEDILPDLIAGFETWGTTYKHWYSGVPVIFISNLEDVQAVLGSRLLSSKGMLYKHLLPWLGRGLLTSSGSKWHTRRKMITPTFHFSILRSFVDIFNKNSDEMISVLRKIDNKNSMDISKFICKCTLDNVCETAMGTSVNAQSGDPNEYVESVLRMGKIVVERMFSPILFPDLNFSLTALGKEHAALLNILHGFTNKVISESKQLLNEESKKPQNDTRLSFLQLLLQKQSEYNLTEKDIREEVDTFMFEGHDTTSLGILWAIYELGWNKDIQERCYREQVKLFSDSNRDPTYQDLMEMSYLKRVLQESLRLYPSVPVISRVFNVDIELRDYVIPARTEIVILLYHIHRNPKVFPDPLKFDPDRFLPEKVATRHPFAYVPFSAGLRNCVGQKFAQLEELIVVSKLIRNFQWETLDLREEVRAVPDITLRPSKPLKLRIAPR